MPPVATKDRSDTAVAQPDRRAATRDDLQAATQLHRAGKLDEAAAVYRAVLARDPDQADALQLLGLIAFRHGDAEGARGLVARALRLRPDSAAFHFNAGIIERALGRTDAARSHYERAIALEPGYAEAHLNLGSLWKDCGASDKAIACFERALACRPDYAAAHNNLGATLESLERLTEAAAHYREAIRLDPTPIDHHHNLATVLTRLDDAAGALDAYRAVMDRDPDHAAARHMVAALSGATTEAAPAAYVAAMFDDYAPRFERHLVEELGYAVPDLMRAAIGRWLPHCRAGPVSTMLDLGCGTGLVGRAFADLATAIDGVDLSPGMLAEARRKGLYRNLHEIDLVRFLDTLDDTAAYDLILAADVLIYLGALERVLPAVRQGLAAGGLFLFSVEGHDGSDYRLLPCGRYAHGDDYIRRCVAAAGLAIRAQEPIVVRRERDRPVYGSLYLTQVTQAERP